MDENLTEEEQPPFFLWIHVTTVHQPYRTSPENLEKILGGREPSHGIQAVMKGAIVPHGSTSFVESDKAVLDALYDEEIRRVDHFFGKVWKALSSANLLEKTLFVMTADHGEELLDHGFVGHASTSLKAKLFEEIIHIPLIISWPGKLPKGKRDSKPVSQIDIFPTIAGLLGWDVADYIQGQDLLAPGTRRQLFFESVVAGNQTTRENEQIWVRGIRDGHYKYISSGELYDLSQDPEELVNMADQQPGIVRKMRASLETWLEESQRLEESLFPPYQGRLTRKSSKCPAIHTPARNSVLDYDLHTGALLFGWTGDMETTYLIEYDIGVGDHHVAGTYEVDGNHQILGPFPRELWGSLKAWNPFRFRVSPKSEEPCWSRWTEFKF
jgi:arylsulfatase A-like enzyme